MTTTKEKIAIMEAAACGEIIQFRRCEDTLNHGWMTVNAGHTPEEDYPWDWVTYDYRINREPRVIFVCEYDKQRGFGGAFGTRQQAARNAGPGLVKIRKFVEVIEE